MCPCASCALASPRPSLPTEASGHSAPSDPPGAGCRCDAPRPSGQDILSQNHSPGAKPGNCPYSGTRDVTKCHLCKGKPRTMPGMHFFHLFGLCESTNSSPVCGCVCTRAHSQCPCTYRGIFKDFLKSSFRLTTKLRGDRGFPRARWQCGFLRVSARHMAERPSFGVCQLFPHN